MSNIIFNLQFAAFLTGMSPPALPGGVFGNAALPANMAATGGMYLILNDEPGNPVNNRYIGIASDILARFAARLPTVTELGLSNQVMSHIGVFWGTAWIENTGGTVIPAPAAGWGNYYAAQPTTSPTAIQAPSPAPPATYNVTIDNVDVNLEHVLIRLIHHMFPGHTISNNQLNAPYLNPTGNAVTLILNHAALGASVPANSWGTQWGLGASI